MSDDMKQYHVFMRDVLGGQVLIYAGYDRSLAERVLLAALSGGSTAWLRRAGKEDSVSWAE